MRSHYCGDVNKSHVGQEVTLVGWVNRSRDLGGVVFLDLRDREGLIQVVYDPDLPEVFNVASTLRAEFCVQVKGLVRARPDSQVNGQMKTGEIEVLGQALTIINAADPLPLSMDNYQNNSEEQRLKYRYLDLRRPEMAQRLIFRAKVTSSVRRFLDSNGFLDIETPILTKATPEGARDYLVPSRTYKGQFFALPQSPQLFKQLLMMSGFDRYYQIVKCFRDEDLRADRQPEFTQIDIEMSFVTENDVMQLAESLALHLFKQVLDIEIPAPIPRLTYREAIDRFGTDRPDTRFDFEIVDISEAAVASDFQVFKSVIESKGQVRAINAKNCACFSRKQIDDLTAFVAQFGAKGLAWIKVTDNGLESSIVKFFPEQAQQKLRESLDAHPGDLLLFVADKHAVVAESLGNLRLELARRQGLMNADQYSFLWVTEFPLLEFDTEANRYVACHHPFTSPIEEDLDKLEHAPGSVRSRAYDLVLNGSEIAGGSIRIHQRDAQERMFRQLGISEEEAQEKFGFLLDAFRYGAPPHGGIAFGYDRLIALMAGKEFIRDVIPFPKTNTAASLMDGAPSTVDPAQLRELGLRLL